MSQQTLMMFDNGSMANLSHTARQQLAHFYQQQQQQQQQWQAQNHAQIQVQAQVYAQAQAQAQAQAIFEMQAMQAHAHTHAKISNQVMLDHTMPSSSLQVCRNRPMQLQVYGGTVAVPMLPTMSQQSVLSNFSNQSCASPESSCSDDESGSLIDDGDEQADRLSEITNPVTGEKEFQCQFCEKRYNGKHARSIWRRHLQDKHAIPLRDQPRRTRWDSNANRPKTAAERRERMLASKRRWARKKRLEAKARNGGFIEGPSGIDIHDTLPQVKREVSPPQLNTFRTAHSMPVHQSKVSLVPRRNDISIAPITSQMPIPSWMMFQQEHDLSSSFNDDTGCLPGYDPRVSETLQQYWDNVSTMDFNIAPPQVLHPMIDKENRDPCLVPLPANSNLSESRHSDVRSLHAPTSYGKYMPNTSSSSPNTMSHPGLQQAEAARTMLAMKMSSPSRDETSHSRATMSSANPWSIKANRPLALKMGFNSSSPIKHTLTTPSRLTNKFLDTPWIPRVPEDRSPLKWLPPTSPSSPGPKAFSGESSPLTERLRRSSSTMPATPQIPSQHKSKFIVKDASEARRDDSGKLTLDARLRMSPSSVNQRKIQGGIFSSPEKISLLPPLGTYGSPVGKKQGTGPITMSTKNVPLARHYLM